MTPQRILHDVKAVVPEDAHIFTDVGWTKNGVAQQFDVNVPGTIHHSSGLATMGFGASAVLGGKLAAPDKVCLTLTGDGGFGVNPTCLATAVEQGIACTWVVMNNSAFGTIAGLENGNYGTKFGTVFQTPDGKSYSPSWAGVAKAYGVESICVQSADEFLPAMKRPWLPTRKAVLSSWKLPWKTSLCRRRAVGTSTIFTARVLLSRKGNLSRMRRVVLSHRITQNLIKENK